MRIGDGYGGWPEHAPFDIVIVTAAPEHVPQPLIDQLKPGGRLIVPVGPRFTVQQLQLIEKDAGQGQRPRTCRRSCSCHCAGRDRCREKKTGETQQCSIALLLW